MPLYYHLTTRPDWQSAQTLGVYKAETLTTQGFIHLSHAQQVAKVANAFYADVPQVIVLVVEGAKLTAELRIEAPDTSLPIGHEADELFPHLYGPLDLAAVVGVAELGRDSAGQYIFPTEAAD
jgi:uncharacterized protein (DUF952 family)